MWRLFYDIQAGLIRQAANGYPINYGDRQNADGTWYLNNPPATANPGSQALHTADTCHRNIFSSHGPNLL